MKNTLFLAVMLVALCIIPCCERPKKKAEKIYQNNYETEKLLLVSSPHRKTEAWVEYQEKPVERTFGKRDHLYIVYKSDEIVGFVTSDKRAYRCTFEHRPYDIQGESNFIPKNKYLGSWKTLEKNVQKILNLPYPVSIY